jgi:hypothetical protein
LDLAFDTQLLRNLCESDQKAKQKLGRAVAEQLKRRVADLRAANTIDDLVASSPYALDGSASLAVELSDGWRVVFAANHTKVPVVGSGAIDWSAVNRIRIVAIEQIGERG